MTVESLRFRQAAGCFATGIAIVTTLAADGSRVGLTVNSFASLSLDPPLVLFSIARTAQSFDAFAGARGFVVNVLSADQQELSNRFAGTRDDRWAGLATAIWDTGAPVIPGCLAVLECDSHARLDGGDHVIEVGRVRKLSFESRGRPLLYFRGSYAALPDPASS
ncbi:MAG: flavin reductase family protein [Azospirillaceae bacterium]|nr:flavin reductase family protein [Azospirillaceae bacterium]